MADVAPVALRFDIVASNDRFKAAVRDSQQSWDAATKEMKSASTGWTSSFAEGFTRMQPYLDAFGDGLQRALTGGRSVAEGEILKLIDKAKEGGEKIGEWLGKGVGDFAAKYLGDRFGWAVGYVVEKSTNATIDKVGRSAVDKLAGLVESTQWAKEFNAALDEQQVALKASGDAASAFGNGILEAIQAGRDAIQVFRGLRLQASEFDPILDAITMRIGQFERATKLIGKSAAEKFRLQAEFDLEDTGIDLNRMSDDQSERYQAKVEEGAAAAAAEEGARKAFDQLQAFKGMTDQFERQIALTEARTREVSKSAGVLAEERMLMDGMARMQARGRELTDQENDALQDQAIRMREITDEATSQNFMRQQQIATGRQVAGILERQSTAGMTAGDAAEYKYRQGVFGAARDQNITLTDADVGRVNAYGRSISAASQRAAEFSDRMQTLREAGSIASRGLEDAFGKFLEGTKINWKDTFRSMLMDLERLAFRKAVLEPIFGGGSANPTGLIGNLFAGFRAGGGPVSGGSAYVVGERGPELFVPQSSGRVVPNGGMGGGTVNMSMSVDLTGANGDAAIAAAVRQGARAGALAAIEQTNATLGATQRRMRLLEA